MIVLQERSRPTPKISRKSEAALELDFDLWHEHEACRQEHQRRVETEPYIRFFCRRIAELAAQATSLRSSGERDAARFYLLGEDLRDLWALLIEGGALLWPYDRFRQSLIHYIREGRAIVFPAWWATANPGTAAARKHLRQWARPEFRERQRERQRQRYWAKKAQGAA